MKGLFFILSNCYRNILAFLPCKGNLEEKASFLRKETGFCKLWKCLLKCLVLVTCQTISGIKYKMQRKQVYGKLISKFDYYFISRCILLLKNVRVDS